MKQLDEIKRMVLVTLLCLVALVAGADCPDGDAPKGPRPRFSPEEYKQKEAAFIIKKAMLSPSEAAAFFPIYHKMKDQQRRLSFKNGDIMRKAHHENLNDAESLAILNEINDNEDEIHDLEVKYQKKFLKIVSPSKLLKIKIAEKAFERKMLSEMARGPRSKKQ